MSRDEAVRLSEQWETLQLRAEAEQLGGSPEAARRLLKESLDILERLRSAGHDPMKLLGVLR